MTALVNAPRLGLPMMMLPLLPANAADLFALGNRQPVMLLITQTSATLTRAVMPLTGHSLCIATHDTLPLTLALWHFPTMPKHLAPKTHDTPPHHAHFFSDAFDDYTKLITG